MLTGMLILWFVLTGLSLVYISYDLFKVTPEAPVMKWGWWLVVLYTGPVGLFCYLLSCKEPMPGTHEAFVAPHWKQALGSMVHCLAGDVTGIILAALLLTLFHLPLPLEIAIEYLAGFAFGLLIFQSFFMKGMMQSSYGKAVKDSFYPEFVSMNWIMAGMIPVMVIWIHLEPSAARPATLHFWGKMSLATIISGFTAYGINSWLVRKGLKHGMTTVHKEGHPMHEHHSQPLVLPKEKKKKLLLSLLALAMGILISIGGSF